jgi:hypothetical protein
MVNKTKNNKKETVKKGKTYKKLSTQRYLNFSSAHDDTLVLKDGGLRAILEIGSVNFNLKSEDEQNSIIYGYQKFLNALNFPVQILMKSRKLDIDQYISSLKVQLKKHTNPLLKKQMIEYIEYIKKLVEYADIMDKKFYVIIPVNPPRAEKQTVLASFLKKIKPDDQLLDIIKRKKEFKTLKKELDDRVNIVQTSLENCGLSINRLNTEKIIELFYQYYNPEMAREQKMTDIENLAVNGNVEDNLVEEE